MIIREFAEIKASPDLVWRTLTDPELTIHYMFGCRAISNWQIGDPLLWKGASDGVTYVKGKVRAYDPPSVLAFTVFDPNAGYDDKEENYLQTTYILKSTTEGTRLEIIQGDFSKVANGEKRYNDSVSAWKSVIDQLKRTAENLVS